MPVRMRSRHEAAGIHADATAEALLVGQFRYWMSGHSTRDFSFVSRAWAALNRAVDDRTAKLVFAEVHLFTSILRDRSIRPIEWLPDLGRCISRDESLALLLVRASQSGEPLIEIAAASDLLGNFDVETLVCASRSLARVLANNDLRLKPIEAVTRLNACEIGIGGCRTLH